MPPLTRTGDAVAGELPAPPSQGDPPLQIRPTRRRDCVLLAFDNTDGPDGGCTTHAALHVLLALPDLALSGLPRLVRLNPNIPWKTRGNGAVVLPLGLPEGPAARVGELRGLHIQAFPEAAPIPKEMAASIVDRAWKALAGIAQPTAHPAVALFDEAPPEAVYWQGVQTLIEVDEARELLDDVGALWRSREASSPGSAPKPDDEQVALPGCVAAAAWPGPAASVEFIAYREPRRWRTERAIDEAPLRVLDGQTAAQATLAGDARLATFHTYDPEAERLACVPHTPDPVLLGLRGRDAEALAATALRVVPLAAREPVDAWLMWDSNQASGDHVAPVDALGQAPILGTIELAATVTGSPESRHGGHVFVPLVDGAGAAFEAAAFEPTKGFRDIVRGLRMGDRVVVVGAVATLDGGPRRLHAHPPEVAVPGTAGAETTNQPVSASLPLVKLEKLRVVELAPQFARAPAPMCPDCAKRMKSAGAGQGYRCRACGTRVPAPAAEVPIERSVAVGWSEVPIIARRHLHRPLAFA